MDKAEKQTELQYLTDCFAKAQLAVCADYHGLTVAEITHLRRELHNCGSVGRVVKNTLAQISAKRGLGQAKDAELKRFVSILDGPSFLVVSFDDAVAPAKVISNFIKQYKKLTVKGAWIDGVFIDAAGVEALSQMPWKQEILGQLLGLLCAPATSLVRLLQAPATQLARVVEGHRKNLEEKGK